MKATPILKGDSAKRFLAEIQGKKISPEQKAFLKECEELYENSNSEIKNNEGDL